MCMWNTETKHVVERWMHKHAKMVKKKVNANEKARYREMFDLLGNLQRSTAV